MPKASLQTSGVSFFVDWAIGGAKGQKIGKNGSLYNRLSTSDNILWDLHNSLNDKLWKPDSIIVLIIHSK